MNILHISSANTWRGGERQIANLCAYQQEHGHQVWLMSPNDSVLYRRSFENLNRGFILLKSPFAMMPNMAKLKAICQSCNIDIIHGHDSYAHTLLWMSYQLGNLKTKSVVTRRLIKNVKARSIPKYNHNKIEKIICVSEAVRQNMANGVKDKSRLQVVYSGISLPTPVLNKKMGDPVNIIYIAAFTEEKAHDTFIKVVRKIVQNNTLGNVLFTLVGDGPLKEKIQKKCQDISAFVRFEGFVEDVEPLLYKADIMLHPSREEALGTSIIDGMAYGIPIISTNIGGIPELIDHGVNGFLCEVDDVEAMTASIERLVTDHKLYSAISEANTSKAQYFDKDEVCRQIMDVYEKVLV